jgi:hypothetical protein
MFIGQDVLVPPGDQRIGEKIRFLMDRPETARAMGTAGCERVLPLLTCDRVAALGLQAYREALQR